MLITITEPPTKAPEQRNSWRYFLSMPHHILFFIGAVQSVLVMVWWLMDLAGRYGHFYSPFAWSVQASSAHLFLMIYSTFPLFMFGFLMTTYPKWMAGNQIKEENYLAAGILLAVSILMAYVGLLTTKLIFIIALILNLIGWGWGLYALLNVYFGAKKPDTLHALVTSFELILGWSLLFVYTLGIGRDNQALVGVAKSGGVWWFLLPVFFSVSHRLIPFFSDILIPNYKVIRPSWALIVITIGSLIHGFLDILNKQNLTWIVDLPMAATAIWLTFAWNLKRSFNARILAILHMAFAWLGIALLLFGIQSYLWFFNIDFQLNRAPLHALMIGYFASMLIAMATRVTLGHSGQPLKADNKAWLIFLAIQIAAFVRVIADLPYISAYAPHLYICSALLWVFAFTSWLVKFSPFYWRTAAIN